MKKSSEIFYEAAIKDIKVGLTNNIELTITKNKIFVEKIYPNCVFCGSIADLIILNNHRICERCRDRIAGAQAGDVLYPISYDK